ncbi:MAG: hypothetical protein JNJ88_17225 [Planctomycetes bacterium]|nr:hypothetical protein [Planctomycetota bacterium]
MRRPSPVLLSIVGALVLFLATTAGILGIQGRLGGVLGGGERHAAEEGSAASKPAEGHTAGAEQVKSDAADHGAGKGAAAAKRDPSDTHSTAKDDGMGRADPASLGAGHSPPKPQAAGWVETGTQAQKPASDAHGSPQVKPVEDHKKTAAAGSHGAKDDHATIGTASSQGATEQGSRGAPEIRNSSGASKEAEHGGAVEGSPAPRRGATASLVQKFSLPPPLTVEEIEEVMSALRASRNAYERMREQIQVEREANERDRVSIDAREQELESLRKRLETEKVEVQSKVGELGKRMRSLEAGESRYVASQVKRIKEMTNDEARTQILREDDFLAAQILNQLPARASGKILLSLPPDRYPGIQKAMMAASAAEARQSPGKESR